MNQNLKSLPDKDLIALFKDGDADAFGVLVEKYTEPLSAVLFHLLRDPMLVEDVLQDTFIRAMGAINKEDGYSHSGTFKGWLLQIGHNLAMDYFRKKKRNRNIINIPSTNGDYLLPIAANERGPEEDIISSETDYDIQLLMDKLPEEQREVINLRHFQNFTFQEITDYIGGGISINTCLGRMRYGLINLRKMIEEVKSEGQKIM